MVRMPIAQRGAWAMNAVPADENGVQAKSLEGHNSVASFKESHRLCVKSQVIKTHHHSIKLPLPENPSS
jgi:hypothetical protein